MHWIWKERRVTDRVIIKKEDVSLFLLHLQVEVGFYELARDQQKKFIKGEVHKIWSSVFTPRQEAEGAKVPENGSS